MRQIYPNYFPYYPARQVPSFPQYPQSEQWAEQMITHPLHPHLKHKVLKEIEPFVAYGLHEAKETSYKHAMQEVAAMTYLMGMGMDPQTAYLTVESWEVDEKFY